MEEEAAVRVAELQGRWVVIPSSSLTDTTEKHFQVVLAEPVCAEVTVGKKAEFNALLASEMTAIINTQ